MNLFYDFWKGYPYQNTLNEESTLIKLKYILSMVERLHCVCDRVMHRHLYNTFWTTGININAPDVKRPKNSLRQLVTRSSSFYLRL